LSHPQADPCIQEAHGCPRASQEDKDLVQASLLCEALLETRQSYLLADAYREAWTRGEAWQEGILSGLELMPDNGKLALANALGVTVDRLGKA